MLTAWLNETMYRFVSMMSEVDPQRYLKSQPLIVTSTSSTVTLPTNFWKAYALAIPITNGSDGYFAATQFEWSERCIGLPSSDPAANRKYLRWTIRGGGDDFGAHTYDGYYRLQFDRTPGYDGVCVLDYFPVVDDLVNDEDVFDVINGVGLDWIIADVCIKCAQREESDPTVFATQLAAAEKLLTSGIGRLTTEPKETPALLSNSLGAMMRAVRSRGPWKREDFTDIDLIEWVNSSACALADLIIVVDPSFFHSTAYTPVQMGVRQYGLPEDFYKIAQISVSDGDGYNVIETYQWEEHLDTTGRDGMDVTQLRWHIRGTDLFLQPEPGVDGVLRLDYIALPTAISDPSATFPYLENGWQEFIILDACTKAATAAGVDAAPWVAQKAETAVDGVLRFDYIALPTAISDPSATFPYLENGWQEFIILDACTKAATAAGVDAAPWVAQKAETAARIKAEVNRNLSEQKTTSVSTTTLAILRSIRTRGSWSRDAFSDGQMTEWINASQAALADIIFQYDQSQFMARADVNVVADTSEYALPADFYRLIGVAVEDASVPDGYSVMERFEWDERYDYAISRSVESARYHICGSTLMIRPNPSWTKVVRLEYMPLPSSLLDADAVPAFTRNGWQEWIILDCCVKAAVAAGTDPAAFMAERAAQVQRIMISAPRDRAKPKTVVDVNRNRFSWRYHDRRRW
jgi:hypothetical protein